MAAKHQKVAIVTGGSSGIGRCTAAALRNKGYTVYEFSRRDIPINGVKHLSVDVTDEKMVESAIHQIMKNESKIDAVINCAGFGISGAVPIMRHQSSGHIINISSVAATTHIPFQTFYSASKAAISSYSYALANEVRPYGIYVTAVELGDICTGFTKSRQKNILGDKEYGGRISRSVRRMEHDERNGMNPKDIGQSIADTVSKKKPAVVYVIGTQYKILSFLCKILPTGLREKIVGRIYG